MWIVISAFNLALAVIFGAFGAHAIKTQVLPEQLAWWQTATDYFFYHALGLLAISILHNLMPQLKLKVPFALMQLGILLFCGSLYAMTLGLPHYLGIITPLGGTLLMVSWLMLAYTAYKNSV